MCRAAFGRPFFLIFTQGFRVPKKGETMMQEIIISERMPVLALRGLTVFPQATVHFDVGREKSVRALDKAMKGDQKIFLVTQRDILQDDPSMDGLYDVGTVAEVRQVLKNAVRWACQEAPIRDFPTWAREAEPMEGFKK